MAIPDYETLMLPLLRLASRTGELKTSEAVRAPAEELGLAETERAVMLHSGVATTFGSRVGMPLAVMLTAAQFDELNRAEAAAGLPKA
jgi:restriction system protein